MKRELVLLLLLVALASGFLIGRRFPTHHYTAFSVKVETDEYPVLVDSATGHICTSFAQTSLEKTMQESLAGLRWATSLFPPCSNRSN